MVAPTQKWWHLASALLLSANAVTADSGPLAAAVSPLGLSIRLSQMKTVRSVSEGGLAPRQVPETCSQPGATCVTCFGAGYRLCPGSSSDCYNPSVPTSECPGGNGGSTPTTTSSAPRPSTTGGGGGTEWCNGRGSDCESCFGDGYKLCPGSTNMCWNPALPGANTACDSNSGGGGTGGTGGSGNATDAGCALEYGTGSKVCGGTSCYNPTKGDVCCSTGSHCPSGTTCSPGGIFCCRPGESSIGCSDDSDPSGTSSFPIPTGLPGLGDDDDDKGPSASGATSLLASLGLSNFVLAILAGGAGFLAFL